MRIIAKSRLNEYGEKYGPDAQKQLSAWHEEAKEAEWRTPQDIRKHYTDASIINSEIVVFNICHNKYRLIVKIWYPGSEVYIKFFGTHGEYDRLDVKEM